MLPIGELIAGRYEIIAKIGDGGMGSVYKAKQVGLDRIIALKTLHPHLLADDNSRERFEREGKILSLLSHAHLMVFFEFGIFDDVNPFMAMEFIDGQNFRQVLGVVAKLEWKRTLLIAEQVAEALVHAHHHNIVHRDLSPNNIMILNDSDDYVKVVDFGLARLFGDGKGALQTLTETGLLVGNPIYMSPEQCLGKKVDARSDIYSFSCILYECLTGEAPFSADNPIGIIHKHINEQARPLSDLAKIPPALSAVISKGLQKDPEKRYQSMDEYLAEIRLIQKGEFDSVSALSEPHIEQNAKSNNLMAVGVALPLLALLAVVAFLFSEPGVASPVAFILRQSKNEQLNQQGERFADWLEGFHHFKSAELIYSTITNIYNPPLPSGRAAVGWFKLCKVQFELHQNNLAVKSLLMGLHALDGLKAAEIAPYSTYINELIPKLLNSGVAYVKDQNVGTIRHLAALFADNNDVETTRNLWRLAIYAPLQEKGYYTCIELLHAIAGLNDAGRRFESNTLAELLHDSFVPSDFKSRKKEFVVALSLCKISLDNNDLKRASRYLQIVEKLATAGFEMDRNDKKDLFLTRGRFYYKTGHPEEAQKCFRDALQIANRIDDGGVVSYAVAEELSEMYWEALKKREAIHVLEECCKIERNTYNSEIYDSAQIRLASYLACEFRSAEAHKIISRLPEKLPHNQQHSLFGVKLTLAVIDADWKSTTQHFREVVTFVPDDGCVNYVLEPFVKAFLAKEKVPWPELRAIADKKAALSPTYMTLTILLAAVKAEHEKTARCFVLLNEAKSKFEHANAITKPSCVIALRVCIRLVAKTFEHMHDKENLQRVIDYCNSFGPEAELAEDVANFQQMKDRIRQ